MIRHLPSARMARDVLPALPAMPLVNLLDRMAESRGSVDELASELHFSPRNLFAWRVGERQYVRFDVADRILTAAGLLWWEVWTEEEYPELHEALAA